MRQALLIAAAVFLVAGCDHAQSYVQRRLEGVKGDTAHVEIKGASAQDISAAIERRALGNGWAKTVPPPQWTSSYTQRTTGIVSQILYPLGLSSRSSVRLDFAVADSTTAATADGRCFLIRATDAPPEQYGGKCLVQIDQMFAQLKDQFEKPKAATK